MVFYVWKQLYSIMIKLIDIVKEVERWESQITVWYDKNHPKRHVTSEYSENKRKYYGWVFTIVLTLAAFLSGFSA